MSYNFEGRTFRVTQSSPGGEVTFETVFRFRQQGAIVYADYAGGAVITGKMIGTLEGDSILFQYLHVNARGVVRGGTTEDRIELSTDGKLRLREQWQWMSEDGSERLSGVSIMAEE